MAQIFSASRREDMPAFHMRELLDKYSKSSSDSFWVLWTKNPRNIISSGMDFSKTALQLTITGLGGSPVEPNVPPARAVWGYTEQLVKEGFRPELINWRMDPIIPGNTTPEMIKMLAERAHALCITRCTTSFITWYGHVIRRWPEGICFQRSIEEQRQIALKVRDILQKYGIRLYGCAQGHLKDIITPSRCIDGPYYRSITGMEFDGDKDPSQRKSCGCTKSVDIGRYGQCGHKCLYCYNKQS